MADIVPTFILDTETSIELTIAPTQAQLADQGYTYNQAGMTYNQAGVMYGGVYNTNQDLSPVFANDTATLLTPSISSILDIGARQGQSAVAGQLIGILGLTYPVAEILI